MSAYTVDKVVIDGLLTAAIKWSQTGPGPFRYYWQGGVAELTPATATVIGQRLWHANWYHADGWAQEMLGDEVDVEPEPVYEYEPLPGVPDPAIVVQLIDNYNYQTASEPEEWFPTEAFGFTRALKDTALARLHLESNLPWDLGPTDRDLFLRYGSPDPA